MAISNSNNKKIQVFDPYSTPTSATSEIATVQPQNGYYPQDPYPKPSFAIAPSANTMIVSAPSKSMVQGNTQFESTPELLSVGSSEGSFSPSSSASSYSCYTNQEYNQPLAVVPYYAPSTPATAQTIVSPLSSSLSPSQVVEDLQLSTTDQSVPSSTTALATTSTETALATTNKNIYKIRVPISMSPYGSDDVNPKKKTMKKQRKRRTAAGTAAGMVVGGLVLGPVGVFVGGAAGGVATRQIHKQRERASQRKHEKKEFQKAANKSKVHCATFA